MEELVKISTAKLAREKGFDIHICRCGGFPDCICDNELPTQSLIQKWLRDVHNIQVYCYSSTKDGNGKYRDYVVYINGQAINDARDQEFQTYEDALEFGITQSLKLWT